VNASRLTDLAVRRTKPTGRARRLVYAYLDVLQQAKRRSTPVGTLPPAELRLRVHGDFDVDSFLGSGRQCSEDIRAALFEVGQDITSFTRILDFGCGCGRTLQWLACVTRGADLHGTDIDREAIAWCRHSIDRAQFSANGELPPLGYSDDHFDLVYAVSVFTHLSEDLQLAWLAELARVTARDGIVLLSVRGSSYSSQLDPQARTELETRGFAFSIMGPQFQQVFPPWYQLATMTEQYIEEAWSRYFEVLCHLPEALDGCQDIVLLRPR
jgi:SAM-dependent methyltransferase